MIMTDHATRQDRIPPEPWGIAEVIGLTVGLILNAAGLYGFVVMTLGGFGNG